MTVELEGNSLFFQRRSSFPVDQGDGGYPMRNSKSLDTSPKPGFKQGIPLGSLTAQIASRSFWNPEMLRESMEKISQTAVKESSMESLVEDSDEDDYKSDTIQISTEELDRDSTINHEEDIRELKHPLSNFGKEGKSGGYTTPPYLSPGLTMKVRLNRNSMDFLIRS